jgi:photosynthetic reaction center H subunit
MPLDITFFGTIDGASLIFLIFVLFFVGLIVYLRREDRREGYPLEDEAGKLESLSGLFFVAQPKTFILPNGEGVLSKPNALRETFQGSARRTSRAPGSPIVPSGDPMKAGIGPGSFAQRAKHPDMTMHGLPKIVPLRTVPEYSIDEKTSDPRGMNVVGADGVVGGVVTDVWIDRVEYMARYLEVAVTPVAGAPLIAAKRVLVPVPMCNVSGRKKVVEVHAVMGAHFAGAPAIQTPESVTFDEEERASAYFGGGLLYANPSRAEPLI